MNEVVQAAPAMSSKHWLSFLLGRRAIKRSFASQSQGGTRTARDFGLSLQRVLTLANV